MGYKMVIHTAGGPVGHFTVELNDGETSDFKGFYPKKEKDLETIGLGPVKGDLKDDFKKVGQSGVLKSKEIELTKEEYGGNAVAGRCPASYHPRKPHLAMAALP